MSNPPTVYVIQLAADLWVGSPVPTETTNPNLAATWAKLQDAQRAAFELGGMVTPFGVNAFEAE
jgi:hypothetical protein